jgi:hypothetical protein
MKVCGLRDPAATNYHDAHQLHPFWLIGSVMRWSSRSPGSEAEKLLAQR